MPCSLTVSLEGEAMRVTAMVKGTSLSAISHSGNLPPARTSDMEEVLRSQFARTGDTKFELCSFSAPDFPPLLIPPTRLKEIRREFYQALAERSTGALRTRKGRGEKEGTGLPGADQELPRSISGQS